MVYNRITVGEMRRVLREGEFKPVVFGDKESEKINKEAYADIKKETSDYDGGLTKEKKDLESGMNVKNGGRGMYDLEYDNVNKPFTDNVRSQMKGYANKQAEDTHKGEKLGNGAYDDDENIYKASKEHAKASKEGRVEASAIGLTGRELDKKEIEKQHKTVYSESVKPKVYKFKNTKFVNEAHMMSRIPDDFKFEGHKFVMKDVAGNEYLVEWHKEEPMVSKKVNMTLVNEEKERMKALWGYKPSEHDTNTDTKLRLQEGSSKCKDLLDRARNLCMES